MKQTKSIVKETEKAEDIVTESNFHKDRYLDALKHNSDELDEEKLGQKLGFSKEYTNKIIEELLADGNITRHTAGTCRYRLA